MARISLSILLVILFVGVFANTVFGLSCHIGDDYQNTVGEDPSWKQCHLTKNIDTKQFSYGGTSDVMNLTRGSCYIKYNHTDLALNIHCYCDFENCNVPGSFDPKY